MSLQPVEGRPHSNPIAWLTTVRPDGRPVTVPVWLLLRDDETILIAETLTIVTVTAANWSLRAETPNGRHSPR